MHEQCCTMRFWLCILPHKEIPDVPNGTPVVCASKTEKSKIKSGIVQKENSVTVMDGTHRDYAADCAI